MVNDIFSPYGVIVVAFLGYFQYDRAAGSWPSSGMLLSVHEDGK